MKKRHWLFTLILIAVLLMAAVPSSTKAQSPDLLTPDRARRAAQQRLDTEVQAGRAPGWAGAALNDPIRLDDLSGTASAYLFPVSQNSESAGYLTVAAIELPNPVLEFATEGSFPLSIPLTTVAESAAETGYALKNGQPLYLGLLNYAYELAPVAESGLSAAATEHYVIDLMSGEIGRIDLDVAAQPLIETASQSPAMQATNISAQAYSLISGVPDWNQFWGSYGCYSGCAPTSGTNVMGYWDGRGYGNLIYGSDWQGAVNEMRSHMGTFCSGSGGSTYINNISPGMAGYAQAHGYYFSAQTWGSTQSSYTNYQAEINAGHPLVVDVLGHQTYSDHSVTGVGYNTSGNYLIVHDNWGSTGENIYLQYGSGYSSIYMHPIFPDTIPPSSYVNSLPTYSPTSFTVSWSGSDNSGGSGLDCYDVQAKVNSGTWYTWRSCTTATSATYTGSSGSTYYFRSRARDRAGNWESYPSGYDASTTIGPPAMPGNLRVSSVGPTRITLAWTDNANNETGFRIYKWGYNGSTWDFYYLTSVGANVTTFSDTGLNCGRDYFYQISAYNSTGESDRTGWVKGTTDVCPPILVYAGYVIDDNAVGESNGNNNGVVECGEDIELYVELYNQGGSAATGVNTTINTNDPYVTWLYNTTSSYPDISVNGGETNYNDFDFALASNTPNGHWLHFNLTTTASNGGPWYCSFSVPATCSTNNVYLPIVVK